MRLMTHVARTLRTVALMGLAVFTAERAFAEPFDHFHLLASDPAKAVAWYKANLGARDGDTPDRVVIGRTIFAFIKTENPPPSAGTAVDHFGFSVPDVDAAMTRLQAAGAKVVTPARDVPGLFKLGFIEDPFGIKIEILQDAETPGLHHIHLLVPDPEASLAFYARHFGGERAKLKGRIDGIKYAKPDVWLLAQKSDSAAPSQGHAIDHIGWAVADLPAKLTSLAAAGAKTTEPRAVRHLSIGFTEGPGGVRIEMVQNRKEEELVGRP